MTKRQNLEDIPLVQYLISHSKGEDFVIEVPADWKLTFGRVNPALAGEQRGGYNDTNAHCVRVWEGEKLRAVFGNATGMRDLSIPLARKVVRTESEEEYKSDSLGNFDLKRSSKQIEEGFELVGDDDRPFS